MIGITRSLAPQSSLDSFDSLASSNILPTTTASTPDSGGADRFTLLFSGRISCGLVSVGESSTHSSDKGKEVDMHT
jgi:hypothetical protein